MAEPHDNRDLTPARDQPDARMWRRWVQRRNGRWAAAVVTVIDNRGRNGGPLGDGPGHG